MKFLKLLLGKKLFYLKRKTFNKLFITNKGVMKNTILWSLLNLASYTERLSRFHCYFWGIGRKREGRKEKYHKTYQN